MEAGNFFIKSGYTPRSSKIYCVTRKIDAPGLIQQSDVYLFAAFLARRFGCTHILDIGCGYARNLVKFHPEFEIIGIDDSKYIEYCRQHYGFGQWIKMDLEAFEQLHLNPSILRKALVICAGVIEHLSDPDSLVDALGELLDYSPIAILTTPERDLSRGTNDYGPPLTPYHVREWNMEELRLYLRSRKLRILFSGLTVNNAQEREKKVSITLLENNYAPSISSAPSEFRVIAVMGVFNEKDIIVPIINQLNQAGIEVYIIDNWSTDGSFELAGQMLNRGVAGIERWPLSIISPIFDFRGLLKRKEELCQKLDADWFIHQDADEIRDSPWQGFSLRDAIYKVDQQGYNAIDFTVLNFMPVDNYYQAGSSFGDYFKYFEFGEHPANFRQIRAWKKPKDRVNLNVTGGHSAEFQGRKIYPYKFLLRHYPIRSQSHAEEKIFHDRKPRYDPVLRKQGWHNHYDIYSPGSTFIKNPKELIEFRSNFYANYLIERISGIGIIFSGTENNQVGQKLEEQELITQLTEIKNNKAWKLALLFGRIRVVIVPPNSKRSKVLSLLFTMIIFPFRNWRKQSNRKTTFQRKK